LRSRPIWRMSIGLPLYSSVELRAMTTKSLDWERSVMKGAQP
jgi:hypothetical protein